MPRIFDNIDQSLLPALRETLALSRRADFCVGYFNLRGWKRIDSQIDAWEDPASSHCRLLIGMQRRPEEEFRAAMSVSGAEQPIDNAAALRLKNRLAAEFREQLAFGAPTNGDEEGLRRLARQLREGRVKVKLFLRHSLHAKLYLLYRDDPNNPTVAFLGSSNLTQSGLAGQGELNVDVLDHDACGKLEQWFEDRWNDRWSIDISDELIRVIEESWARETAIPPHHIYLKMAYHLSHEARAGLAEFQVPADFGRELFDFQTAAVKIAAHHVNTRGGVLIGDVVGLGKTLMATALARILEDDLGLETLIICPPNLVPMWEEHRDRYRLRARVLSLGKVERELPNLRRYRVVVIDESHNLRNREGRRYRAIQEYILANESKCILLTATPYNKSYLDLASQLRLFVAEDADLGVRPERLLRELGETEFIRRHQASLRSLAAFEHSPYPEDWRELMRMFLVRRTRSFIQANYAEVDEENDRRYLSFEDGSRSYFPDRVPRTVAFELDEADREDQYAQLYGPAVADAIARLHLPRYGLGNYVAEAPAEPPTPGEAEALDNLSRAGKRLMGFSRTNLFKRLESGGHAFLQSVERHVLRNEVYLYALDNGLPLPLGPQDPELMDSRFSDEDEPSGAEGTLLDEEHYSATLRSEAEFRQRAAAVYASYREQHGRRFRWLRSDLFDERLRADLATDAGILRGILAGAGEWDPARDRKLAALERLVAEAHAGEKVLVFTQFADTVHYLVRELERRGVGGVAAVTGDSADPTELAWRFSPASNGKREAVASGDELRVLVATDVLSEGQNLQDCAVVVNYDLPWAIIRLVQRAGRVDRIGQRAESILCHSFLPAEGVERIIRLRARVRRRLEENAEVVGTDEAFFEDDHDERAILDLYHEKAGVLDGEAETEVDLASYAYQVWSNAVTADPALAKIVPELPPVAYSTRSHEADEGRPGGALVYMRTATGNDALAWVDEAGESVTQSQLDILKAAECGPDEPALPRPENQHELVGVAMQSIVAEERTAGGQLGRPSGARFRTYERLKGYATEVEGTVFDTRELGSAIEDIYRYPLRPTAVDTLNRQLRSGIADPELAELVVALRDEGRLVLEDDEAEAAEPEIICSLGLVAPAKGP